jgi:hypothetical protein
MRNVKGAAIFLRLGNRGRPYRAERPGVGAMRNIVISNVQATELGDWIEREGKRVVGCSITGLPDHPIENLTLDNIRIQLKGGGTLKDASREVAERPDAYPSCRMFGTLPAYGFFCRHVRNVRFHNVDLRFAHDDHRPALVFDDVRDLSIFNFDAQSTLSTPALIRLRQVDGVLIHGSRPREMAGPLLRIEGHESANIRLFGNDLTRVGRVADIGEEVPPGALFLRSDHDDGK